MLTIDYDNKRVTWNGKDPVLTLTEFLIVEELALRPGANVSYRRIYDVMKGKEGFIAGEGQNGYRVNVRSAIKRMRKKLILVGAPIDVLINYQAVGYALNKDYLQPGKCCPSCGQMIIIYMPPPAMVTADDIELRVVS